MVFGVRPRDHGRLENRKRQHQNAEVKIGQIRARKGIHKKAVGNFTRKMLGKC